ncbi:hypothetical protein SNEBB_007753 [Seison nebaliae]|nr:hypothetical protein SNEBB_007753 [Seison nebaliae]
MKLSNYFDRSTSNPVTSVEGSNSANDEAIPPILEKKLSEEPLPTKSVVKENNKENDGDDNNNDDNTSNQNSSSGSRFFKDFKSRTFSKMSSDTPTTENNLDPSRYDGDGISFKGKFIGIENTDSNNSAEECRRAMVKMKALVQHYGNHKPKILVKVNLEGVRIYDEQGAVLLHEHPVSKISYISRDVNDARAFGYLFLNESGREQFIGIKTEKAAELTVMALKDLFQITLEMRKKQADRIRRDTLDAQGLDLSIAAEDVKPNDPKTADQLCNLIGEINTLNQNITAIAEEQTEPVPSTEKTDEGESSGMDDLFGAPLPSPSTKAHQEISAMFDDLEITQKPPVQSVYSPSTDLKFDMFGAPIQQTHPTPPTQPTPTSPNNMSSLFAAPSIPFNSPTPQQPSPFGLGGIFTPTPTPAPEIPQVNILQPQTLQTKPVEKKNKPKEKTADDMFADFSVDSIIGKSSANDDGFNRNDKPKKTLAEMQAEAKPQTPQQVSATDDLINPFV